MMNLLHILKKIEPEKREWTNWMPYKNSDNLYYIHNGQEIKMHCGKYNVTAKVSCHKDDKFDLELGLEICHKKLSSVKLYRRIKELEKMKRINDRELRKIIREL